MRRSAGLKVLAPFSTMMVRVSALEVFYEKNFQLEADNILIAQESLAKRLGGSQIANSQ
jgi:hypothetical protein